MGLTNLALEYFKHEFQVILMKMVPRYLGTTVPGNMDSVPGGKTKGHRNRFLLLTFPAFLPSE